MDTIRAAVTVTGAPKKKHCSRTNANESNYVDLGGTSTVKVTSTGEENQPDVFDHRENREEPDRLSDEGHPKKWKDDLADDASTEPKDTNSDVMDLTNESSPVTEEPDNADMYLNSRCESESEDEDRSMMDAVQSEQTETHFITTHEIQLTELDHDVDHELGRTASSCWDFEDDNLVYSFVDYASFKSDSTPDRRVRHPPKPGVSTESECYESDEGGRNATGHVRLPVKSLSNTVNSDGPPSGENDALLRYSGQPGKVQAPYDMRAHCFIPAPGRQHLASKLKGKDVTEYSSGASSSVSELDDADKEVRNLTAKSFRSLACPYFDTIDLRPSSESSVSEHGLGINKWSALVDLNYRNYITQGGKRKNSTCSLEIRKHPECENGSAVAEARATLNYRSTQLSASTACNARTDSLTARERRAICIQRGSTDGESGGDATREPMFASSLLKDVISKKMRSEQERGEIRDSQLRDSEGGRGLHEETTENESGRSVVSVEELVVAMDTISREEEEQKEATPQNLPAANVKPQVILEGENTTMESAKECESEDNQVPPVTDATPVPAATSEFTEAKKECTNPQSGKTTQMSHLYLPGSHFLPKDIETPNNLSVRTRTNTSETLNKPPETMLRLQSVEENKNEQRFNIANFLMPNLTKTGTDAKTQPNEKVPHFTVRDVRDSRCKLQTPIHQVRDVRKLVKSSYKFVSLDTGENKCTLLSLRDDLDTVKKEPDKTDKSDDKAFPMPMVIKCQSVNNQSQRENQRSSPKAMKQPLGDPPELQVNTSRWKTEKSSDGGYKRIEWKPSNQAAIEKLKAAVKTMEQLYVFDHNEWRRKTESSHPVADSHVLSLITSEEQAVDGERLAVNSELPLFRENPTSPFRTIANTQDVSKIQRVSNIQEDMGSAAKASVTKAEERLKDKGGVTCAETRQQPVADSENYLSIPIKPCLPETRPHPLNQSHTPRPQSQPRPPLQRSPVVTESWSPASLALMFQHAVPAAQMVCIAPSEEPQTPNTQCKLLLDPMTGQCYLVDMSVALQPVTQRLYYPEGARYVDVPMPVALSPASCVTCPPTHYPSVSLEGDTRSAGAVTVMGNAKPLVSIRSQQGLF